MTGERERRVSGRVEEIVHGWWRIGKQKFKKCRSLDVSMDGALIVLDEVLPPDVQFDLHFDMDDDWSVALEAERLWQRPIFFGKQQLTAVRYRFVKTEDQSMFGLWLQRKLAALNKAHGDYLAPIKKKPEPKSGEPILSEARRVRVSRDGWRSTLSSVGARIPWIEAETVPNDRRGQARGQVGMKLRFELGEQSMVAELLNVSLYGACVFVPSANADRVGLLKFLSSWMSKDDRRGDLVVPDTSLLVGAARCKVEVIWEHAGESLDGRSECGRVFGLRFADEFKFVKKTFIGDLLNRINYSSRQIRDELRFPCRVPLELTLPGTDDVLLAETVDLSSGGCKVLCDAQIPVPSDLLIKLKLPRWRNGESAVRLSARVLRVKLDNTDGNCYSLAFRKGQSSDRLELSRWLAHLLRIQDLGELVPDFEDADHDVGRADEN